MLAVLFRPKQKKYRKLYDEMINKTFNCVKNRFKDIDELKFCKLLNSEK